ncbi:MAG: TonB-dependent receptor [Candidatus Marinimicrobia bacterium]|nr:TonB-dependent receptor [Candidatus Neomarinimicrobiota bacterium]|tara:strand:- start:15514 stop:18006 length:2493 start_codon:yes stop_codon:yes gene_type:complete
MQLLKTVIILILILSYYVYGVSSKSVINGTIVKNDSNLPLRGANVLFESETGNNYGASTDDNGFYSVSGVSAGDYTIKISFIGFEDYKESIIIEEGKKYKIDAALTIQPILMAKLEIISKLDKSYDDLPGAATVLDMQTLRLVNPIGTQEMLEYIPGINGFADDGVGNSRISIGIRGLNPRRSSRTLILEDGVPIQPALYVYPNMYYNPPSDRIDQIEVIKGSSSILYGPHTMGGVINYFTRRPRDLFGGSFKFTGGQNGYTSLFTEIGGWGSDKINPEIQFLLKRGDGFRQNNEFEQINTTLKINYNQSPTKNLYFKANFNFENSNATYTGLTEYSFYNDPKFNPKEDDNFRVYRTALDLIQTEQVNTDIIKNTTIFISFFDRRWWREYDMFIRPGSLNNKNEYDENDEVPSNDYINDYIDLVRVGGGTSEYGFKNFGILRTFYVAGLERSYNIKHDLFNYSSNMDVGWRVYWERFIDDRKEGEEPESRDGVYYIGDIDSATIVGKSQHYETMAFSGFISESIEFEKIMIRPGLRFEIFEQERIDRLQGSIYLDKTEYVILPGLAFTSSLFGINLFGGIHRGYTPPSSGALNIVNFGENYKDGGLDVEPEMSWNKEIGFRGVSRLMEYEVAAFHINIENLIAAGRGTAFLNLGTVTTMGLETRTHFFLSNISAIIPDLNIIYCLLNTRIDEGEIPSAIYTVNADLNGNVLPYSPRHTLTLGLETRLSDKAHIRCDVKYVDKVFTDFENIEFPMNKGIRGTIDSYTILNLSANISISSRLNIFLSGKNVTDEIYIGSRLHSNPRQKQPEISSGILPGPRRQINVGIGYSF